MTRCIFVCVCMYLLFPPLKFRYFSSVSIDVICDAILFCGTIRSLIWFYDQWSTHNPTVFLGCCVVLLRSTVCCRCEWMHDRCDEIFNDLRSSSSSIVLPTRLGQWIDFMICFTQPCLSKVRPIGPYVRYLGRPRKEMECAMRCKAVQNNKCRWGVYGRWITIRFRTVARDFVRVSWKCTSTRTRTRTSPATSIVPYA